MSINGRFRNVCALYPAGCTVAVVVALRSEPEAVFAQSETSVSSSMTSSVVSPSGAVESLNRPLVSSDPSSDRGTSLMSRVRRESSTELRLHRGR